MHQSLIRACLTKRFHLLFWANAAEVLGIKTTSISLDGELYMQEKDHVCVRSDTEKVSLSSLKHIGNASFDEVCRNGTEPVSCEVIRVLKSENDSNEPENGCYEPGSRSPEPVLMIVWKDGIAERVGMAELFNPQVCHTRWTQKLVILG
jgi:hypothetical protein